MKRVRKVIESTYKRPLIFKSVNIFGILLSVVGIIICVSLAFGSFYLNSKVSDASRKVENIIYEQLDFAESSVVFIEAKVAVIDNLDDVIEFIDSQVDKNVERLESSLVAMDALNFGGRLDDPIRKVDSLISRLEKIKEVTGTVSDFKEKVFSKLSEIREQIKSTSKDVSRNATLVRRYSLLGSISIAIVAAILLLGQLSLIRRCSSNFKNRKAITTA